LKENDLDGNHQFEQHLENTWVDQQSTMNETFPSSTKTGDRYNSAEEEKMNSGRTALKGGYHLHRTIAT